MIEVIRVRDRVEGQLKAHDLLKEMVDMQTALFLSGGTSPDYRKIIVEPGDLEMGAICVVDDRFGEPFHPESTELLLKSHGVKDCADGKCIETHKILKGKELKETGSVYAEEVEGVLTKFPKRVGVMGVGTNLHTGGIFPNSPAATSDELAIGYDVEDKYRQRVTITFKALEQFTGFVVLMFGEEKREAFGIILDENEEDRVKYPAVFYRQSGIRTFIVTDIL